MRWTSTSFISFAPYRTYLFRAHLGPLSAQADPLVMTAYPCTGRHKTPDERRNEVLNEAPFWRRALSWSVAVALVFVATIVIYDNLKPRNALLRTVLGLDFQAFYCAGKAAAAGADPYRLEPLRSCEHHVEVLPGMDASEVIPAPHPGYTIAIFEMLSHLPYGIAKFVWGGLLIASLVLTAFILAKLTGFPLLTIFFGLAAADGFVNIADGQLTPLCIAFLCVAAYLIGRGKHDWAAVPAALTLIEPHVGLPGFLAMFVWLPRSRIALLLGAIALSVVGILAIGFGPSVEYLRAVLPAHALAEVPASHQYSLTHVLYVLGASERAALTLGSLSFAVMVAVGVAIARHVATALQSDEFLVLFPVAASLLGGSFVHDYQIAAALPAAFLLAARANAVKLVAWSALFLLVAPAASRWAGHIAGPITLGVIVAVAIYLLAFQALRASDPARRAVGSAAAAAAFVLAVLAIRAVPASAQSAPPGPPNLPIPVVQPDALASSTWGAMVRWKNGWTHPSETRLMLQKLPTWIGLGLLIIASASQRKQKAPEIV